MKFFRFGLVLLGSIVFINTVFSQNIKGKNYEIVKLEGYSDSVTCIGIGISNPFSPSMRDFEYKFALSGSSLLKIKVYSCCKSDTVLNIITNIPKGCYQLIWFSQNIENMEPGLYYISFEAVSINNYYPKLYLLRKIQIN